MRCGNYNSFSTGPHHCPVTADEIKVLYHRFMKLDREKKGIVTVDDFLMIPELAMNPLSQRIVEMFDSDADGNINFKFFVSALSVFHDKASEEQKKHCTIGFETHSMVMMCCAVLFAVYDVDSDGYIGSEDMVRIFDLMVGDSMEKHKLTQAVDEIIDAADKDGDGKLSFQEFQSVRIPVLMRAVGLM